MPRITLASSSMHEPFTCEPDTLDLMIIRHLPASTIELRHRVLHKLTEHFGEDRTLALIPKVETLVLSECLIILAEFYETYEKEG